MKSFHLWLLSNVSDVFGGNTISNFKTKLGQTLRLDENWEVILAEISYVKSWYNIKLPQIIAVEDLDGNLYENKTALIKPGCYDDPGELISIINKKLKLCVSDSFNNPKTIPPSLDFDTHSRRVSMRAGRIKDFKPLFGIIGNELKEMFGLNFEEDLHYENISVGGDIVSIAADVIKGDIDAYRTYDLTAGINSLFIYCDIVNTSLIGDTHKQLLRIVRVPKSSFGEALEKIYEQPIYFRLSTYEFDTIEIDIRDKAGERIQFEDSDIILVLHFRYNELH